MTPEIKKCTVNQCFYNANDLCHADAITVGDSTCARCDTFISNNQHAQPAPKGHVGACHEADCEYNQQLMCHANGIDVGMHMGHADCMTYEPR